MFLLPEERPAGGPRGGAARTRRADGRARAARGSRHAAGAAVPGGLEQVVVGMGCFWGAERVFWRAQGVYTTAVGYAGGYHAEPDLRGGLLRPHRPHRGGARRLRPGARSPTTAFYACSGRTTTRPRGCARATTSARSTGRPSTGRARRSGTPSRRRAPLFGAELERAGYGEITDRARRGGAVLLRRGLPPAVPREEPERLLRARRHRRRLPGRAQRDLTSHSDFGAAPCVSARGRDRRRTTAFVRSARSEAPETPMRSRRRRSRSRRR